MVASLSAAAILTGTAILLVASLGLILARASRRAGLLHPGTLAISVVVVLVVWLGAIAALADSGVRADWSASPPRWPLFGVAALMAFVVLTATATFRRLLIEIPAWQLVAVQTFRVGVELAFWRPHAEGLAPVQVAFEGRNFDALIGHTAPFVAVGLMTGLIGPRFYVVWNLFGLAMLFNAIGTVATSAPGSLHLDWPGEPFTAIVAWPVLWIPAFLAPAAIGLHVVSIRQAQAPTSPLPDSSCRTGGSRSNGSPTASTPAETDPSPDSRR